MVEIHHANEPFECFDIGGPGKIFDGCDFAWKWSDAVFCNLVAKKIDLGDAKLALFEFDDKSVILQAVEKGHQVSFVFFMVPACYQNVIMLDQ